MVPTSLAMREQLAHPLLQLHSYAHSYLPTLSLHGQLYEVYTWQFRTIGLAPYGNGPPIYLNWAAMMTLYMRTHGQWLRMAYQGVEEVYLASFRKTSREFWREYDGRCGTSATTSTPKRADARVSCFLRWHP